MGDGNREELIAENEKELAGAFADARPMLNHMLVMLRSLYQFPACSTNPDFLCIVIALYLAGFASGASSTITPVLERVLEEIRVTGVPRYSWAHLKKLLLAKLQVAMDQVAASDTTSTTVGVGWSPTNKNKSSERRSNITELLNTFEGCD